RSDRRRSWQSLRHDRSRRRQYKLPRGLRHGVRADGPSEFYRGPGEAKHDREKGSDFREVSAAALNLTLSGEDRMYSHRRQNLIDCLSALGGLPRRRLLQGAGTVSLATMLRPTGLYAEVDDDDERVSGDDREKAHNICRQHRFGQFS